MKKLFINLSVAGLVTAGLIGCGPSAEEKLAAEQHIKDSLAQVAYTDSMMMVQQKITEDSLMMVKMTEDSLAREKAIADSIAAIKPGSKPKPKPKPTEPAKPTDVKPGQGRG